MNPAKKLNRAKPFFTQPLAETRQSVQVKIKQIGGHRCDAAPWQSKRAASLARARTTRQRAMA
jgi:hypothetical protein